MGCNQLIIHIVVIKNFILLSYKEPLKYLKRLNPLHLIHRCCLYQYSLFFIETLFIHEIMRNNDDCLCTYFIGTADNKWFLRHFSYEQWCHKVTGDTVLVD